MKLKKANGNLKNKVQVVAQKVQIKSQKIVAG